jgi:hypothetical protein
MKKILIAVGVLAGCAGMAGIGHADTLTGKVVDVNAEGNAITLATEADASGKPAEYKIVWDEDRQDLQQLEQCRIGDTLTVDADQNPVSRNYKVTAVRSPLAAIDRALRTGEQAIRGEVKEINTEANSMLLTSEEKDEAGQPIEYRVVWDDSNTEVRDKLEKANMGDNIAVRADQNVVSRNWKANVVLGPVEGMMAGDDAKTLSGEVRQVDPERNFIVLGTTDEQGRAVERKIVWDKDFKDQARLENARIGERLSVRADQNFISRNWKVKSIG